MFFTSTMYNSFSSSKCLTWNPIWNGAISVLSWEKPCTRIILSTSIWQSFLHFLKAKNINNNLKYPKNSFPRKIEKINFKVHWNCWHRDKIGFSSPILSSVSDELQHLFLTLMSWCCLKFSFWDVSNSHTGVCNGPLPMG